jgi:hypothetical protein
MNLSSGTHNFCERREYAFNVLLEYNIIIHDLIQSIDMCFEYGPFINRILLTSALRVMVKEH